MAQITKDDVIRQLFEAICYLAFRHKCSWKDAPGTPEERLKKILCHARSGLAVVKGIVPPSEAGSELAERIAMRDLAASGGIVDAP